MRIELIRTDGTHEVVDRPYSEIRELIGADTLDSVRLPNGRTMLVDDTGHPKALPYNAEATSLYHSICRPGTTHRILGDVAVVREGDL